MNYSGLAEGVTKQTVQEGTGKEWFFEKKLKELQDSVEEKELPILGRDAIKLL